MIFTSKQLSQLLGMSRYGFHKLVKNLHIPYTKHKNKFVFDTNSHQFPEFFSSVQMAYANPELQVIYSLRDLSHKRGRHKDTIKKILIENDVKMYYSGRKTLILLIDLQLMAEKRHLLTKIA